MLQFRLRTLMLATTFVGMYAYIVSIPTFGTTQWLPLVLLAVPMTLAFIGLVRNRFEGMLCGIIFGWLADVLILMAHSALTS